MTFLPVDAIIPQLKDCLARETRAVLTAPPGSGKTTRAPLALSALLGKVLVLQPRRLAARAAASYMARELGERVGESVGYQVRLEKRTSAATRVEFVTEGILTRRLLSDPALNGVGCVIFDEFHERSLQADLGLALCLEVQTLRPDLRILVMSATLDADDLARHLGGCPVIRAEGKLWPVELRYLPPAGSLAADPVPATVAAIRRALAEEPGSILAFLPGAGEIRRAAEALGNTLNSGSDRLREHISVHTLYGDLPLAEQDAAIAPAAEGRRKIVLSTALAETSLTIEGVRVVIDCGLSRTVRFDPATGMDRLVTARLAQAGADQRAGRAGRTEPGVCYRLWHAGDTLLPYACPEIMEADLAGTLLSVLSWGAQPQDLPWLTPPPRAALEHAQKTLLLLGAVELAEGRLRITPQGEALSGLPLHPRLGHMLLKAEDTALGALLAALVSERDPLRAGGSAGGGGQAHGCDLRLRLAALRPNSFIWRMAERIFKMLKPNLPFSLKDDAGQSRQTNVTGRLLSLAWPERIAMRRARGSFRLAGGQGGELPPEDALADAPFLAIAVMNTASGRIRLAAPLDKTDIEKLHGAQISIEESVQWETRAEAVLARRRVCLHALVLQETPLLNPEPEAVKSAVLSGILGLGLNCLTWPEDLRQWQARVLFMRALEGEAWPDVSDAALGRPEAAGKWLYPWLEGVTRRAQFAYINLSAALQALLPYPLARRLEQEAPTHFSAPSGTMAKIDYTPAKTGLPPVLAIKLQEMFGQLATPVIGGGRCPLVLHLLSPARRPLQVTQDLQGFWQNGYAAVRAEMRGRYPKHPWPEDPVKAVPTGKTKAH